MINPEDVHTLYKPDDHIQKANYDKLINADAQKKNLETGRYQKPWKFEVVPGFFRQSDPETDLYTFDYINEDFGLKKPLWQHLIDEVTELNKNSPPTEQYKVLFLARHGQGWHNHAIHMYGQKDWNEIYGKQLTNGEIVWGPDPYLTPLGENQAKDNNAAWKKQLAKGAPMPQAFYCSPFTRSIQTLVGTWDGITDYHFEIKEDVRETMGLHYCDQRVSKSEIEKRHAGVSFHFEPGFEEEDVYFQDDYRETTAEQAYRAHRFLNFLYEKDFEAEEPHQFVNVTSHSGTIRCFIMALGHRDFAIGTGGMIPVVVKGTRRLDDL